MKSSSIARLTYRLLLHLHPVSFRARFGEEMLWIFDQKSGKKSTPHLLADGLCSLLRQRAKSMQPAEQPGTGLYLEVATSKLPARRLAQSGIVILLVLSSFALFSSPHGPLPRVSGPFPSISSVALRKHQWLLTLIQLRMR